MRKKALAPASVGTEEVPVPLCGRGSVLIANRHSLISAGTETTAVKSTKRDMVVKALRDPDIRESVVEMLTHDGVKKTAERVQFEMTKWTALGYSGAGIAVEVGSDVDGIGVGDLVAYGGQGHAEYVRVPKNLCVKVPRGLSTREAAFVALGSIALQGVRRADVQVGDTVVVIGLGLVGQLVSQLLQVAGARVLGTDLVAERRALAEKLGAEAVLAPTSDLPGQITRLTGGRGADRVVICASTSSPQVMEQAVAMSRDRGRIVVVGQVNMSVPHGPFYMKELELVISRSYGPGRYDVEYEQYGRDYPLGYVRWTERRNMEEFLRLAQSDKVDIASLITHEFTIDRAAEGYALIQERPEECLGVLIEYGADASSPTRVVSVAGSSQRRAVQPTEGRIAVIGCGSFARQFHLPFLRDSKKLHFKTLVASSSQSAAEMARRYGAERAATDPQEIWNDPEIDAVMIFTRDKTHASLAAEALRAGKHVFCEKPLATTPEECDMLRAAAAGRDLICMTGFNRRFAPLMQQLKTLLDRLDGPRMVVVRVNAGALPQGHWAFDSSQAEGRIIGEVCHFVDLIHWLTGARLDSITAIPLDKNRKAVELEDAVATLRFEDGSVGTIVYTAQGSPLIGKERVEVFCSGTSFVMDDFRTLTVRGVSRVDLRRRTVDKGHQAELLHFQNVLLGQTVCDISLEDGIRASEVCFEIVARARGTGFGENDDQEGTRGTPRSRGIGV